MRDPVDPRVTSHMILTRGTGQEGLREDGAFAKKGVPARGSLEEEEPGVPGEDRLATWLPLSCS